MKVKIIGAQHDTFWYANRVGEVFEVEDELDRYENENNYAVVGMPFLIDTRDCEITET
ncbi:MAG: hypothetical protein WC677_07610 [Clostridia bacterium]|jgi:hypothetical protein